MAKEFDLIKIIQKLRQIKFIMKSNETQNHFKTLTWDHARKVLFVESEDENDNEKKEQVKKSISKVEDKIGNDMKLRLQNKMRIEE